MDPNTNVPHIAIGGNSNYPSAQRGSAGSIHSSDMSDISSNTFYALLSLQFGPSVPATLGRTATVVKQEQTNRRNHISLGEILSMRPMENRTVNEQTAAAEDNWRNPPHDSDKLAEFSNIHLPNMPTQPLDRNSSEFDIISDSNTDEKVNQVGHELIQSRAEEKKVLKKRGRKPIDKSQFYCHQCYVTVSPEWRKGPDGLNTLCNACGLQYARKLKAEKKRKNKKNPEEKFEQRGRDEGSKALGQRQIKDKTGSVNKKRSARQKKKARTDNGSSTSAEKPSEQTQKNQSIKGKGDLSFILN